MTRLGSIASNHLALKSDLCGHSALLPVAAAIEEIGQGVTVWHVTKRARCSQCKVRGQNAFRIVYVGNGLKALQEARDKP